MCKYRIKLFREGSQYSVDSNVNLVQNVLHYAMKLMQSHDKYNRHISPYFTQIQKPMECITVESKDI